MNNDTRFKDVLITGSARIFGDTYGEYATFTNLTTRTINNIDTTNLKYLQGLQSNIQQQLDDLNLATEPNQNAFSNAVINDDTAHTIAAKSTTDTINFLAGGNVTLGVKKKDGKEYVEISTTFDNYSSDIHFVNAAASDAVGISGKIKESNNWRVVGTSGSDNIAYLEIGTTGASTSECMPVKLIQYSKTFNSRPIRSFTLMDRNGSTKLCNDLYNKNGDLIYTVSDDGKNSFFGNENVITNITGSILNVNCDAYLNGKFYVGDLVINGTSLDQLKKSVSDGKQKIASAITQMGINTSEGATFLEMSNNIKKIGKVDSTLVTATPADILSGKTILTGDGSTLVGTMNNFTGVNISICIDDNVIISADQTKALINLPSEINGFISDGTIIYTHIKNLIPSNIKSGVVLGNSKGQITGTFTNDATAIKDDIRDGKTAYIKGVKVTGTAKVFTNTHLTITNKQVITLEPGFYAENNTITCKTNETATTVVDSTATATANDLLKDKTAWVNGSMITGTIESITNNVIAYPGKDVTLKGYYDCIVHVDTAATAKASDIRLGATAWVDGQLVIGTYNQSDSINSIITSHNINATGDQLLSGYTAYGMLSDGHGGYEPGVMYGTIPVASEYDCRDVTLGPGSSYTISKGYFYKSFTVRSEIQVGGTATASDIVQGKTAYVNGNLITGNLSTIVGVTSASASINSGEGMYIYIPSGVYKGNVKCYINVDNKDLGYASKSQVLAGTTFTSSSGYCLNGSMPNNGSLTLTINPGTSKYFPAGYYTGGILTVADNNATRLEKVNTGYIYFPADNFFTGSYSVINFPVSIDGEIVFRILYGYSPTGVVYGPKYVHMESTKNGISLYGWYFQMLNSTQLKVKLESTINGKGGWIQVAPYKIVDNGW